MPGVSTRQAVILAAGRGSRMGEATRDSPKCLTPLAGRPLLDWTLRALRANGIDDILIIAGWHGDALADWPAELRINPRWDAANMVRSLQCADDWLARAPTLVVYGDGAYGEAAIASALAGDAASELVMPVDVEWRSLWQRRFDDPLQDAEALQRDGNALLGIGGRAASLDAIDGQFMGLLHLQPDGWRDVAGWLDRCDAAFGTTRVDRMDITTMLQGLLDDGLGVRCVDVAGGWVEIDSMSDVAVVEQALDEPGFRHDFRR